MTLANHRKQVFILEVFVLLSSHYDCVSMRNHKDSGNASHLEERASFVRVIRAAYPSTTLHNAHDDLARRLIKNVLFDVGLGNFTIRAPILACCRVRHTRKDADDVFLLLADLS